MVILGEFNIVLHHDYVRLADVLPMLREGPPTQQCGDHGAGAADESIDEADLVTEMK